MQFHASAIQMQLSCNYMCDFGTNSKTERHYGNVNLLIKQQTWIKYHLNYKKWAIYEGVFISLWSIR